MAGRVTVDELVADHRPAGRDGARRPSCCSSVAGWRWASTGDTALRVHSWASLCRSNCGDHGAEGPVAGSVTRVLPSVARPAPAGRSGRRPHSAAAQRRSPGTVLRKLLVAVLAVPVLVAIYAPRPCGDPGSSARGAAIGLGAVVGARGRVLRPAQPHDRHPTDRHRARSPRRPSDDVGTGVELEAAATIGFSARRWSALRSRPRCPSTPPTAVELRLECRRHVRDHRAGRALGRRTRTTRSRSSRAPWPGPAGRSRRPCAPAFLTRGPATAVAGRHGTARPSGSAVGTAFTIGFDRAGRPGQPSAGSIRLDPAVPGRLTVEAATIDGLPRVTFTPPAPSRPNTRYQLVVDGVRDEDGVPVEPSRHGRPTTIAPEVVRFRPTAAPQDVDARHGHLGALHPVDGPRVDQAAPSRSSSSGKPDQGHDHVRRERHGRSSSTRPRSSPYDTRVVATVAKSARSADGAPLSQAEQIASSGPTRSPSPKPAHRTRRRRRLRRRWRRRRRLASGGGSWGAVERYYLGLMNCTRTGGRVTSGGDCSSPGGRNVAALKLDSGISSKVARPYAKKLAVGGDCSHFIGGNPGDRLRRAGYTSYRWAENLGCRSGNPYSAVLGQPPATSRARGRGAAGRPLRQPDEQPVRPRRDRRLGVRRPGPPGRRLLPPLDRDHRATARTPFGGRP